MKKLLIMICVLLMAAGAYASPTTDIDKKVIQTFEARFPNAQEATWHESTDQYLVNFVEKGIPSKVTYKKDGTLLNFMRYYQEETLPYHIQANLKNKYAGKKVFGVTEVTDADASIEYFVKLGDDKQWMTVKIDNSGFMTVIERFKNGVNKRN